MMDHARHGFNRMEHMVEPVPKPTGAKHMPVLHLLRQHHFSDHYSHAYPYAGAQ